MTVLFDSVLVKWQGSIVLDLRAHGATGACQRRASMMVKGLESSPQPPTTLHSRHQHHHLLVLTAHSSPHPTKQTLSFPFDIGGNRGSGINAVCPGSTICTRETWYPKPMLFLLFTASQTYPLRDCLGIWGPLSFGQPPTLSLGSDHFVSIILAFLCSS